MKVILLKNIPRLGARGDVKEVKDGYAQNYLLPQKLAALPGSVIIKPESTKKDKSKSNSSKQVVLDKISKISLEFVSEANEQGTLYASIDKKKVQDSLGKNGLQVGIHSIKPAHIKELGEHIVDLILDGGVTAQLKIYIKAK